MTGIRGLTFGAITLRRQVEDVKDGVAVRDGHGFCYSCHTAVALAAKLCITERATQGHVVKVNSIYQWIDAPHENGWVS